MTTATVAVVQLKGSRGLDGNLEAAASGLDKAAAQGAQFVQLPENFAYFGIKNLAENAAAEALPGGPARSLLREKARQHGFWLLGGTIPVADEPGGKPYAASLLVSPEGEAIARYNKIHLFDVAVAETGKNYRESDDYRAGTEVVTADLPWCKLGLSVCYDLRFPELYRVQSGRGATLLAAPSAFTAATGNAHWQLLLRARAVENLSFMVAANMADRQHPKSPTWGGSAIIDPWGRVLAGLDDEEGIAVAELDFAALETVRRNMPALTHRRIFSC